MGSRTHSLHHLLPGSSSLVLTLHLSRDPAAWDFSVLLQHPGPASRPLHPWCPLSRMPPSSQSFSKC